MRAPLEYDVAILIERINAAWFTLDLFLVLFLIYYVVTEQRNRKKLLTHIISPSKWWSGELPLYLQAVTAILIFHIGDVVVRSLIWYMRHEINQGDDPFDMYLPVHPTRILATFSIIAGIGILCKLRVFSGKIIGNWLWIVAAIAAVLMAMFTTTLP